MARALALIVAVLMLAAQKGDSSPTARIAICANKDCTRTANVGFAPAHVRVTYYVPRHADNRMAEFALFCSNGYEGRSRWQLDGEHETMPQWIVTYRDIAGGECQAVIVVLKADGSTKEGRSGRVIVQPS